MKRMTEVITDDGEQQWPKWATEYRHDGKRYTFDFFAPNAEEAARMLRSMRGNAEIVGGPIVEEVRAPRYLAWLVLPYVSVKTALRNLFKI